MAYPPKRIVVLEDDDLLAAEIEKALRTEFGDSLVIVSIPREIEFIDQFPELQLSPPDLFILDVRVIWSYLLPNLRLPDTEHADRTAAGIRCLKKIQASLPHIPAILWSLLDEGGVQVKAEMNGVPKIDYVSKEDGISAVLWQATRLLQHG